MQNLPLAYDYNLKTWFNYPNSAVRHFVNPDVHDSALPWKDRMYTFNSGCYNCHVSQLNSNYDLAFYQFKNNQKSEAVQTLKKIIDKTPQYINAVSLLCNIYTRDGKNSEAIAVYKKVLSAEGVSEENKAAVRQAIDMLEQIK